MCLIFAKTVSLLPGLVYLLTPVCMLWAKPRITMYPPGGSSVADSAKVVRLVYGNLKGLKASDEDWEAAKPTNMRESGKYDVVAANHSTGWISWDDKFVDELKTTLKAFAVFSLMPIWYMADGGTTTVLTNMAGSMTTNGLPNDLLNNFNPISTVVAIPIYNWVLYPGLRKRGINFSLIQRMSCGYFIGAILNACAAIIQWQIYETSPCGYQASDCSIGTGVSPLVSVPLRLGATFQLAGCDTDELIVRLAHHHTILAPATWRHHGLRQLVRDRLHHDSAGDEGQCHCGFLLHLCHLAGCP